MFILKRHICKSLLTVAIFSILLASPIVSFAKEKNIKTELSKKESVHKKLSLKAKSLNKEVKSLRRNLISLSKNLQNREANLLATEKSLKELKTKKHLYIESIYKENQSMGGIVSAARKYSRNPVIAILTHDDPIKAARSLTIIKSVIPSIDKKSKFLKEQLTQLEEVERNISSKLASHKTQKHKINSEVKQLSSLVNRRKKLYEKTKKETKEYEKQLAKLKKESKNLEELMHNIKTKIKRRPNAIAELDLPKSSNGKFMPVSGNFHTKFGETDDMGAESKGITFTTLSGARVVTPMNGTVKFAGPFQGHKSLLIIEHPKGYHSLISGLERVDTVVGASLAAGEPVGVANQELEAPRIYYELRKRGKPINPQKILIANLKQGKG